MGNVFRVINCDGDIEISIYKKANAIFKTNEYSETEDVCIHKETINIFNLLKENQELKKQLEEYQLQNIDLKTDIMIQKMAFPNKLIKDKTFYDLYNMPTYEELLAQQKEFIKYLEDEIQKKRKKSTTLTAFIRNVVPLQQCLQKYKSIIGVSDGKEN